MQPSSHKQPLPYEISNYEMPPLPVQINSQAWQTKTQARHSADIQMQLVQKVLQRQSAKTQKL